MGIEERLKAKLEELKVHAISLDSKASFTQTATGHVNAIIGVLEEIVGPYACDVCGKRFEAEKSRRMHKLAAHKISPKG